MHFTGLDPGRGPGGGGQAPHQFKNGAKFLCLRVVPRVTLGGG